MTIHTNKLTNPESLRELVRERALEDGGVTPLDRKALAALKGGGTYEYGLCISMVYDEPIVVGTGSHAQRYRRAERACKDALAM